MPVCALAIAACSGDASGPSQLTLEELGQVTYGGILDEPVVLTDGRFEGEPFTRDSASRQVITLVPDAVARGDLTGDGNEEAVVLLAHNAGGSGVFMHLAVVRRQDGNPRNLATASLGDRVKVSAVEIADGRIVVDAVEHAPGDPMCCPTRQVRREWRVADAQLLPLGPESESPGGRFRGHLVWGHESRSFTTCDGGREGWVINDSGAELVEVYEELTSTPYQPMFVEVRGEWVEAPAEGFGADFSEALRVTELLRAENEGFGCRLELGDVLFVASGNEPFWRLQIREDGVVMRSMNAPEEIGFPAPRRSGQSPRVVYQVEGHDSALRISLEQRRCVDSMSGARYAWAATVEIDGKRLTGCAAEGI